MPGLLDEKLLLDRVRAALESDKVLSLVLDYDGTLSPIAPTPDLAVAGEGVLPALKALESCARVRTAVLSGRTRPELERFLPGLENTELIGDHGAALEGPARYSECVTRYKYALAWLPQQFPGALIEDKETALGIHFRQAAPDAAPELLAAFFDWWLAHGNLSAFQVAPGKKVLEIRPRVKTNKGTAVLGLLERWFGSVWPVRTLAVYMGDDLTDEDAFAALHAAAGAEHAACILVAEQDRTSAAHYRIPSVSRVRALLESLALCAREAGGRDPGAADAAASGK
jgi:trehalose 6-phosphate phosphatase